MLFVSVAMGAEVEAVVLAVEEVSLQPTMEASTQTAIQERIRFFMFVFFLVASAMVRNLPSASRLD
jgi:hypothetical protein